jgi:hypothetical protein
MTFEKRHDVSAIEWVDSISGEFLTSTTKVGALKLWSAS